MESYVTSPLVSVVMNAYNAEKYIGETIDSILCQTLSDFELIIIDDGSSDRTKSIIQSYSDDRIILIENPYNMGQPKSANIGIARARGKYIARMDADDICYSNRLEEEVNFLEKNSDISLISCDMKEFGIKNSIIKNPTDHDQIVVNLLFSTVLMHPGFMMRRADIEKYHYKYNEDFKYALDYEFQCRVSKRLKLANLNKILIKYRTHAQQISSDKKKEQRSYANKVRDMQLKELDIHLKQKYLDIYGDILSDEHRLTLREWIFINDLFKRMMRNNRRKGIYNQTLLNRKLRNMYETMLNREGFDFKKQLINKYLTLETKA